MSTHANAENNSKQIYFTYAYAYDKLFVRDSVYSNELVFGADKVKTATHTFDGNGNVVPNI